MATVAPTETWAYALRLPHDPRAVRVARMTVRAALEGHGMSEVLDTAELLTSELVTNVYQHTEGPASLRLTSLGDGRLRVGVWDSDPRVPPQFGEAVTAKASRTPTELEGGRGLQLLRTCADSWGAWSLGDGRLGRRGAGKLLWFECSSPDQWPATRP